MGDIYSEIKIVTIPKMKVAKYVIISPNPERDVMSYMNKWAKESGLLDIKDFSPRKIGWDFPFVTKEQSEKFGLRGYVFAYSIPENFEPKINGAQLDYIEQDTYATLRVTDPHSNSFKNIPEGYHRLFNFVNSGEYKTLTWENRIAFEEEFDIDGIHYMDIYIPVK